MKIYKTMIRPVATEFLDF